ncbi:MAG: adenylyl-sulfate kinase [Chitinophagaceae bacterium]
MIIQLCGLSGVGKTSIAFRVKQQLEEVRIIAEVIDGDEYRLHLCKDLGYSKKDRSENIRRLGHIANEFSLQNKIAIISAINPYENIRVELFHQYKFVKPSSLIAP